MPSLMAGLYEIRDPIHDAIFIDDRERQVVDHPWLQRLRSIRQLGFVSVVYPGAVHDRFQHSLGVMHLAGQMWDRLCAQSPHWASQLAERDSAYAKTLVRLSGLLHDCGHAPFSHTSERFLPRRMAFTLPPHWLTAEQPDPEEQAHHEDATLALIAGLGDDGALDCGLAQDVAAVLSQRVKPTKRLAALGNLRGILQALVSGEVDADRCDYLLRDSHFTGVTYGTFDLTRILACLRVLRGPDGDELGLDVHGVHPLEGLLLARYHMFAQVYFHKTPPAFEYYLERAIAEGEITYDLSRGLADIVEQRDDTLTGQLWSAEHEGRPWSRRIIRREPALLVLRERMGGERQENFLHDDLVQALSDAGCSVFERHSRQVFTRLDGAGMVPGRRMLCERRVLGRPLVETITNHSDLLAQFNSPLDLRHVYVLREDGERARRVIEAHPW